MSQSNELPSTSEQPGTSSSNGSTSGNRKIDNARQKEIQKIDRILNGSLDEDEMKVRREIDTLVESLMQNSHTGSEDDENENDLLDAAFMTRNHKEKLKNLQQQLQTQRSETNKELLALIVQQKDRLNDLRRKHAAEIAEMEALNHLLLEKVSNNNHLEQ